jgi:hypothetical protein
MKSSRQRLPSAIKEAIDIINSIQEVSIHSIQGDRLYVFFENEIMTYSIELIAQNLELYEECHEHLVPEVVFVNLNTVYIKLLKS